MCYYPSRTFVTRADLNIGKYLTIRHLARKGCGSIDYKAKPNGLLPVALEGEGSNSRTKKVLIKIPNAS